MVDVRIRVRIEDFDFPKDGLSKLDYWFYGREGGDFVYYEDKLFGKEDKVLLKNLRGEPEIRVAPITPKIDRFYAPRSRGSLSSIVSAVRQIKQIEKGYLAIHASCVSKNGEGILLAAFPNVGKTLSAHQLLSSNNEFRYISDDTVLVDSKGMAYLTAFPSAAGYYDFLRFIKPKSVGRLKYYTSFIKSWFMHKNKVLNRLLRPPHFNLAEIYPTAPQTKVKVVCTLEIGQKQIKSTSPEDMMKKIMAINEYSLPRFYNNPFIKVYDYFNPGYIDKIRRKERDNLLSFLTNCECYNLACNDWNWASLIKELIG